jgi:DNA processing protein
MGQTQHLARLGQPTLEAPAALAMVGSRNPTPQGLQNAHDFALSLAHAGLSVVSGLALGVDGAAHEGALIGGTPSNPIYTVAVVGTGLDRVYPKSHQDLAHRIAHNGLLLSEYHLGTPPITANFPKRNRLIAGLSQGCLVVEAAMRSGSLITAR